MRQFAADASHELRTPLTTIRGFAELYRQGAASSPEQTARLVRRIEDEAARMGLLVEDLLLLARLDQERPLEHAPGRPARDRRRRGRERPRRSRRTAPDRPRHRARCRIARRHRRRAAAAPGASTNLMTNALTYTPAASPVTVRLRTHPSGPASPSCRSSTTGRGSTRRRSITSSSASTGPTRRGRDGTKMT